MKFGGLVGPGEVLLLVYCARVLVDSRTRQISVGRFNLPFWYLLLLTLLTGYLLRPAVSAFPDVFPRTLIAYLFAFTVTTAMTYDSAVQENPLLLARTYVETQTVFAVGAASLALAGLRTLAGMDLYWQDSYRFQGWSTDPNQFAIMFIGTPFLAAHVATHSRSRRAYLVLACLLIALFGVQRATDSDSLLLSWAVAAIYLLAHAVARSRPAIKVPLFLTSLLLALPWRLGSTQREFLKPLLDSVLGKDDQGATRLDIWSDSFEIFWLSPVFGLGPEVGPIATSGRILEAHNNLLYLGMSAGIVGVFLYLTYFTVVLVRSISGRNTFLVAAVIALFVFGLTHTTVRHPIYWATLVMIATLASEPRSRDRSHSCPRGATSASIVGTTKP